MLFDLLLRRLITTGALSIVDADGRVRAYGDGSGKRVRLKLHDPKLSTTLAFNPRLRIGEAYVDGSLTVEEGTIQDFLYLVGRNQMAAQNSLFARAARMLHGMKNAVDTYNPVGRAQRNVSHHYDLNGDFFELFLDSDRQYSCGYFRTPDTDIETAQIDKKAHIAKKLRIEPGMRVLDIGSGWGGMGLYLARNYDCDVTGVTLSSEQYKVSNARAAELSLDDRVRFELKDYRLLNDRFDRIVSVGMFEHVGHRHYDEFFSKVNALMADDGMALIHTIGRMGPPEPISPWMRKYIFPGAYLPSVSQVSRAIEKQLLWMTDFEVWRHHYAETLLRWHDRFQTNRDRVREIYDERFCRMWELYLLGCEMGFRIQDMCVFQIQLSRKIDTVPTVRDYMYRN